jgi:hypothetical protein
LGNRVTETFFLPDEVDSKEWTLPADIYNLSRTLLGRSEFDCVFVPIRSMQYLGIITRNEIVFVDSLAYAYQENEGGRLIMLAWKFGSTTDRDSLNEPMPCQVIQYHPDVDKIQLRLIGAYREALDLLDRRYRNSALPAGGARIVRLE